MTNKGVVQIDENMIRERITWCLAYDPEKPCLGASGRRLRQDCVWCPNYYYNFKAGGGLSPMDTMPEIVAGMKKEMEALENRIIKLEGLNEALHKVELSIVEMSGRITTMEGAVERIAKSVNELKEKPAKRWDGIVDKIITAVVTAFITYIVTTTWLSRT